MALFPSATRAALVGIVCPRCGERQLRAREKHDHAYACRRCHHVFVVAREGAKKPPRR